jgi:hypothetical protein
MSFSDIMKKAFPFISAAAALGGPLGTMAAAVVGKAIGADKIPAPTADAISNAIASAIGDPTQRAALIQAEQQFQAQMAELGYKDAEELAATAAADRANARQREMTIRDRLPAILAVTITVGFFGILYLAFIRGVNEQSRDLANIMIGTLGTAWVSVISYYFGSSAGSEAKTQILAAAATKPNQPRQGGV